MLRRKAFKFRLKTNASTKQCLARIAGCNRLVWNKALCLQKERLDNKERRQSYYQMAPLLLQWKEDEKTCFLAECPSQTLQQTLMSLDRAIKDAFDPKSLKRFPRFKKKGKSDSFRYPQGVKVKDNEVFLPKVGWVRFFKSRDIVGTIKNATISRRGQHWFVSIQTEQEVPAIPSDSKSIVGIDLGIKKFAVLSDGTKFRPFNSFKRRMKRLAHLQRSLSRKERGSQNFIKQKRKISQVHIKVANARQDYLHKTSTSICKNHAYVVLEDLKISNMSKSAKGDKLGPGKRVKAKSGLNRSILDQGWHMFRTLLQYKIEDHGGELVLVGPAYTSQRCSKCERVDSENRTTQARFCCTHCSFAANADYNAALNILAAGHAVLACGDTRLVAA